MIESRKASRRKYRYSYEMFKGTSRDKLLECLNGIGGSGGRVVHVEEVTEYKYDAWSRKNVQVHVGWRVLVETEYI